VLCEAEISLINSILNFLLQIKIDDSFTLRDNYDECNALVIPSEKRRTKTRNDKVTVKRILSKTQRKRLQKIVDKKKKKENVSVQN
jgi:ATP-dependent RNA helicase DHX37/DHR1